MYLHVKNTCLYAIAFNTCLNAELQVVKVAVAPFRIYDHQTEGKAFTSPQKLLESLSPEMKDLLGLSLEEHLQAQGFSDTFMEQLVLGALRMNYGQDNSIHAFVGEALYMHLHIHVLFVLAGTELCVHP